MNTNEKVLTQKVNYLIKEFGMNKSFISNKIGCSRVTLSNIVNDNNKKLSIASKKTVDKLIKELNEKFPMCENVG